MQAIDQIINSGAKTHYMSGGIQPCSITFRGPNGFASGVGAQHSQVCVYRLCVEFPCGSTGADYKPRTTLRGTEAFLG